MSDEISQCYTMLKSLLTRAQALDMLKAMHAAMQTAADTLLSFSAVSSSEEEEAAKTLLSFSKTSSEDDTLKSVLQETTRMLSAIEARSFCGATVSDIALMYQKPAKREDNDANNGIRETMIANIHDFPEFYFTHEVYGDRWLQLRDQVHTTVSGFCDKPFDTYKIEKKGGRSFNYDFEATYKKDGKTVFTQKMEYKHNTKTMTGFPQFLSLYEKYGLLPGSSYTRSFYERVLPQIVALDPAFPCAIPDYETYTKHVCSANHDVLPFFRAAYDRLTKEKIALVDRSITDYLEEHAASIDIAKFTAKARESQSEKKFLLWDRERFHVGEFGAKAFDNLVYKRIKNGNSIVIGNDAYEFHLLLRWRNGKGCNLPAWQIGFVPIV